jgi:hypothetical protein
LRRGVETRSLSVFNSSVGDVVPDVPGFQGGKQNDLELIDTGVYFNLDIDWIVDVLTN